MAFKYNDINYDVEIIRKGNKNLYIRVINNKIIVTCNYLITKKSIEKLINDNSKTIIKMINQSTKKNELNNKFIIFGKEYEVMYDYKELEIIDNRIYVLNEQKLNKWLSKYIYTTFDSHLKYCYSLFEESIPVPSLKIRKMKTRWGVCNIKSKNITLNSELIKYDIVCLDYVIIHELTHLIYPNHSKDFWLLVSKYCPDYKLKRKMLK